MGTVAEIEPRDPGRLSMYVCGPTVSGDPHVGHGRFNLTWDIIRRYVTWSGLEVHFVSNVTDIEDKIIRRAAEDKSTTEAVAAYYEDVWFATMGRLGIERPDEDPHATAYVEHMVALIDTLVARGHAYVGGDGVYFASETIEGYGLLARQPLDTLRAGARVSLDTEAGKRSPIDFVLWKFAKAGEPSWPSPWGAGRPGWHTECVVMSLDLLGDGFDLHGGGNDLAFPHHENERAQAIGAGRRFARRWVHSGMVVAKGGEKMSKSVGNVTSLIELIDAHGPRALRLQVLQSHYRSPLEISDDTLSATARALRGLDRFADEFAAARAVAPEPRARAAFVERMDDDLDTPRAVAGLFDLVRRARATEAEATEAEALAAMVLDGFERALGLPLGADAAGSGAEVTTQVETLTAARDAARRHKDWAEADRLRNELETLGWTLEDSPGGTVLRRTETL
jgi:cysteinyl-tRNA synthetase